MTSTMPSPQTHSHTRRYFVAQLFSVAKHFARTVHTHTHTVAGPLQQYALQQHDPFTPPQRAAAASNHVPTPNAHSYTHTNTRTQRICADMRSALSGLCQKVCASVCVCVCLCMVSPLSDDRHPFKNVEATALRAVGRPFGRDSL